MATTLTPTQRYAAGALLALALRQAQIHQSAPLGLGGASPDDDEQRASSASGGSSASASTATTTSDAAADADLWTHDSRGLLRPVFRFLEIEPQAWAGLEETAASPEAKHHIGAVRIPFPPAPALISLGVPNSPSRGRGSLILGFLFSTGG